MKNKTFLITRPGHDLITNYLLYWSKKLIDIAAEKGVDVIDVKEKKVTKKEVASRLKKMRPHLVMLNGHGDQNRIGGHNNDILIDTKTADLLKGAITYARSCHSAHTLGYASVKQGAKAYIGYVRPFYMAYDRNKVTRPLEDEVAELFLEPSNQVVVSLLKGHTASESSRRSKKLSQNMILKMSSSTASPEEKIYSRLLWSNMQNQVCLGDASAQI